MYMHVSDERMRVLRRVAVMLLAVGSTCFNA